MSTGDSNESSFLPGVRVFPASPSLGLHFRPTESYLQFRPLVAEHLPPSRLQDRPQLRILLDEVQLSANLCSYLSTVSSFDFGDLALNGHPWIRMTGLPEPGFWVVDDVGGILTADFDFCC